MADSGNGLGGHPVVKLAGGLVSGTARAVIRRIGIGPARRAGHRAAGARAAGSHGRAAGLPTRVTEKARPEQVSTAPTPAKKRSVKKSAPDLDPGQLQVSPGESLWTEGELGQVRDELGAEATRLRAEISVAESDLAGLLRDSGDGAGDDQADVGSKAFEREHEMSLANNARDLLGQTDRALRRIQDGTYGLCEICSNPIGKARLRAFPRAGLCLVCKQREERR